MPYLVTRVKPRSNEIKIEDLLMDMVTEKMLKPVTNGEATGTRTYFYKEIAPEKLEQLNIPRQIEALELWFENHKYLLEELEDPQYNHMLQAELTKKYGSYNTEQIAEELKERGYRYSDIYKTFYLLKSSSKPGQKKWRQIDAPREDLKEALSQLKQMFELMMDGCFYHTAAFAYIPKRRTVDLGIKHKNNKSNWFLKMDFSNFFGSTTPDFIMNMFSLVYPFSEIVKYDNGKKALENCLRLCVLDGGLPQGTPISPTLTNIIMIPIDHKLFNGLNKQREHGPSGGEYGYVYTRYADDIYISNRVKFDFRRVEKYVNSVLNYFGAPFKINKSKTRYASNAGANWMLGYMLNQDNEITVGHKRKKQLKAALSNFMMDVQAGEHWPLEEVQVLAGELAYCRSIETEQIDILLNRLSEKYGNVRATIKTALSA